MVSPAEETRSSSEAFPVPLQRSLKKLTVASGAVLSVKSEADCRRMRSDLRSAPV